MDRYNDLQREDVAVMFMRQPTAYSSNLSVTANPPVSWLPHIFINSEVVLWVTDGNPFLRLYRMSSPTTAYAVFLKKRPGGQVQLGPRLLISIAVSQDAAMDMIAQNLFGPSPFRWSELRDWKNSIRLILGSNGYGVEEVHHFGADLFLPRRIYLNPPILFDIVSDINPQSTSIVLSAKRRVSLQRVTCAPVPLIWHMPLKSTAVWVAELRDQLKARALRTLFQSFPPDVLASIIEETCIAYACVVYVKHARVSFADVFVVAGLSEALGVMASCMHVDEPLENYYNYMDSIDSNLAIVGVSVRLQCQAGNDRIYADTSL